MSAVLITGATTPVGHAIVGALLRDPRVRRVVAVGYEAEEASGLPDHPRLRYVETDLLRARNVRDLLFGAGVEERVELVLHGALHRSAFDAGRRVHALNVETTRELLALAERHPTIRRFVFRSTSEVYRLEPHLPAIITEEHPLNLDPRAPQWVRDRVEADLTVCTRMGLVPLEVVVLRCAECLAPDSGSQLWDYLGSRICLRPLGFDPMLNLISTQDLARACALALHGRGQGIFNVPGRDTLPLSAVIVRHGRRDVPAPGFALGPLYRLRSRVRGTQFRYDQNYWRFHFSGVMDGRRAREALGYAPAVGVQPCLHSL